MKMLAFLGNYVNLLVMETRQVSSKSLELINSYRDFSVGKVHLNVPYFNNKTVGQRAALRVEAGKGSVEEILNEVKEIAIKHRVNPSDLTQENLKKLMVDANIGIDCSGFAFHVLDEESIDRKKGELRGNLKFPYHKSFLDKIRIKIRAIENAGVKTFAHDENSRVIELKSIMPGDMITMIGNEDGVMRDHILVIYKVEYENNLPKNVYYVHSVAWPTHGAYGHGVFDGKIEIKDLNRNISDANWIESGKTGEENYTLTRVKRSQTEIRRLNWF